MSDRQEAPETVFYGDDCTLHITAIEEETPLWLSVLEWTLLLAVIWLVGHIIKPLYWACAGTFVAIRLWDAWVRHYREMTRDDFYG